MSIKQVAISAHKAPVNMVKINYDGDLLFAASNDFRVTMFYAYSGERIGTFSCKAAVKKIDITRDSKYLITCTLNGFIQIFEVEGGLCLGGFNFDRLIRSMSLLAGDKQFLVLSDAIVNEEITQSKIHLLSLAKLKELFI